MKKTNDENKALVQGDAGDYTVKKSRVFDNVAKVVTLLLAISIWIYVVATNVVEKPISFDVVKERNGLDFSDRVTIEYHSLTVRGPSNVVDSIQKLQLENFNAKLLDGEDENGNVEILLGFKEGTIPKGVSDILKPNGGSLGTKGQVKVTVNIGRSHTLTIPKEYVTVTDGYELAQDNVTLTVRCLSPDNAHSVFHQLEEYLKQPHHEKMQSAISIIANVEEGSDLNAVSISISFLGDFKGQVYEVLGSEGTLYTVKVAEKSAEQEVVE